VKKRIVIIGAGFGGIALAKSLRGKPFEVLLLDKHNYHTFQPLLYQVATGGLEADSIAYPVRRIFRGSGNVRFQMAEVLDLELEKKCVKTSLGDVPYDYLVIATGSTNNFFNFEPIKELLRPLKSVPDALDLRSYLMQNLEEAIATFDPGSRQELMNIAIVGGGPTGIEMAGALSEMKRFVLPKDFPQIDFDMMTISLFEAAPRLLANMSAPASAYALQHLKEMGVQVHLNTFVKAVSDNLVELADGSTFSTETVIWTAGVKGNPIAGIAKESMGAGNRILINEFNQVQGLDQVYAIGDVSSFVETEESKGLPMLATVAIQHGQHLAKNFQRMQKDQPLVPFVYHNKGTMATIGRNRAVVDLPKWKFQGAFAWFVWMFVHIMSLVGFRNRVVTFLDWAGNYISYDRPLGLIIRPSKKKAVRVDEQPPA